MKVYCDWCGWTGKSDECTMDGHGIPAYCPECGHDWVRLTQPTDFDELHAMWAEATECDCE